MSKSAIKPTFYQQFTTDLKEIEEEAPIDENQKALAHITHFKGWDLLKEYAERLEAQLDTMVSESMANGASMKELGERTMVKELSKFVLKSFIDKADGARRAEK